MDQRPNFATPSQMHPVGFHATWPDRDSGAVFVSRVIAADNAPLYTVSMQQNPDAPEKVRQSLTLHLSESAVLPVC